MTNAQMLDLLAARLGNRTSTVLRAILLQELSAQIQELEVGPDKPWFMESRWDTATVANQDYLALPADFLEEVDEGVVVLQNSEGGWSSLIKQTREGLERETLNEDPSLPEGYALYGTRMYLGPTPDQVYNVRVPYYAKTTLPVADNTDVMSNPWLTEFFNFTTMHVLLKVARHHTHNERLAKEAQASLIPAAIAFVRAVESRKHANMQYLLSDTET